MSCEDARQAFDAYLDRELDPAAATTVRDHLAQCVACHRRLIRRDALARVVQAVPYYSAPERLRARVSRQARQARSRRRLGSWLAVAALLVAVAGGAALFRSASTGESPNVEEVVSGHLRSLMADHLVDVRSGDQHTVKPWFLGKLDFSPPVVDLAGLGYPLVGGRIDYVGGTPVAALVYQRRQHAINVFVCRDQGAELPAEYIRTLRGFHVHHWTRDGLSFWAVSDLSDTELTDFVRALRGDV